MTAATASQRAPAGDYSIAGDGQARCASPCRAWLRIVAGAPRGASSNRRLRAGPLRSAMFGEPRRSMREPRAGGLPTQSAGKRTRYKAIGSRIVEWPWLNTGAPSICGTGR
ncbi:hypothetical protein LvStA_04379 [Burkholderia gladioli]|nr:hypothetical protein LvStA_04379 [Burkholderia gladioli]